MKNFQKFIAVLVIFTYASCTSSTKEIEKSSIKTNKIVIDETDKVYGYYLSVLPKGEKIKGVLVLLPGFGQKSEDIFLDTSLHEYAHQNDILTIGFAGFTRLTADSLIQSKLTAILEDVIQKHNPDINNFFIGGFSAGGNIALRYAELCKEFPDKFPVNPKGVFMADSPVDMFHSWSLHEAILKNDFSRKISIDEANFVRKYYTSFYGGTPKEKPEVFKKLSPFSINKEMGTNEVFLKDVAVRAYHDVDISWRLVNRNQTARFDNYIATSELINRLLLLGNDQAEFIQTFQTGYRRDGKRHPHSWSIIDAEECIQWINKLIG